jgi:ABC-2 type transport system ATP-binding protein
MPATPCGSARLEHVSKRFPLKPPPVFTRQQRLARLFSMLRRVAAPPGRARPDKPLASPAAALADISLAIEPGAVLAIVGEPGSGKTTLLRTIGRLERPTRGQVVVQGRVAGVFALSEGGCHRRLSVRDNILLTAMRLGLGRRWIREHLRSAVVEANLKSDLHTPLSELPREAYWRLAWSLAVRARPDILLLDEVIWDFDDALADAVRREIEARRAARQTTVVAAGKLSSLAPLCTRVVHLIEGHVSDRPPAEDSRQAPTADVYGYHSGRHWYWLSSHKEGWATYLFLNPDQYQKRLAQGHTLIRAIPPWVNEAGVCTLDQWWPARAAAGAPNAPDDANAADEPECV